MFSRTLKWIIAVSLVIRTAAFLWQYFFPLAFDQTVQNFVDFWAYYVPQLKLMSLGHLPYRDFAYSYPPLFIFTLYPFYLLGASLASIPIIVADALTAPLLYLIVRKHASERLAIVASLCYLLSPFFLTYEGLAWLSEQPMLFFLLLSIALLQEERPRSSAIAFGISIMFKQDALFMLPAYSFWVIRRQGARKGLRRLTLVGAVILVISIPFLAISPVGYLYSLSLGRLFPGYSPPISLPPGGSGGITFGSTASFSGLLPTLTCSDLIHNIFEVSRFCIGVGPNGQTLTNWVLIPAPQAVRDVLVAFAFIFLVPAIIEILAIPRERRFSYSFAVSFAGILLPLFLLLQLTTYKYYLVPLFALLLATSSDWPSLAIAAAFPVLALFSSYDYITTILPIIEMHFLAVNWFLRGRLRIKAVQEPSPASAEADGPNTSRT